MILENRTTDKRFSDRWLFEIPQRTGPSGYNPFNDLNEAVDINIENNAKVQSHGIKDGNELLSIPDGLSSYYWLQNNKQRLIIAYLSPFEMGYMVEDVGKNTETSINVHASNFYNRIVKSGVKLLFSGDKISDEGERIWDYLLKDGAKLLGYDSSDPKNFFPIKSKQDMNKFIDNTKNYRNLRFVLSESAQKSMIEWNQFEIYRIYNLVHGNS